MEVIRRYELGLSRVLTSKGIQIGGLIGYKELAITQSPEKNGCDFLIEKYLYNPCIGYWWKILNDRYTPFFKKSVVAFLEGDCIDFIVALSRILTKTDVILDLDFVINNLKRNN
jgi:hypothetical protein